jgi:hypothetical protein
VYKTATSATEGIQSWRQVIPESWAEGKIPALTRLPRTSAWRLRIPVERRLASRDLRWNSRSAALSFATLQANKYYKIIHRNTLNSSTYFFAICIRTICCVFAALSLVKKWSCMILPKLPHLHVLSSPDCMLNAAFSLLLSLGMLVLMIVNWEVNLL